MANILHFSGDVLLRNIHGMRKTEFVRRFPGVVGRRQDSFDMLVGEAVGVVPVWDAAAGRFDRNLLPVERVVQFKANPSRHECDARCLNATGRTMQCECQCGGKNHGRGAVLVWF